MRGPPWRRFLLAAFPVALAAGVVVLVLVLADEDEPGGADGGGVDIPAGEPAQPIEEPESEAEPEDSTATGSTEEREVARAVRSYIDAIDARDGAAVCASLAPRAIEDFELPRGGDGCPAAVGASIGYRDPRGFPVFDSARIDSLGDIAIGAGQARATATVVTQFADRDEPSIEDDVVYLVDVDGEWRVARPSSTLYRAVGKPEVPPRALAPPG